MYVGMYVLLLYLLQRVIDSEIKKKVIKKEHLRN